MKKKFFIKEDKPFIIEKIKESFSAVFPITIIVLLLSFTITPIESGVFIAFVFGAIFAVVGIGLFTLGADMAMTPIGQTVGSATIKTQKLWIIIPVFFVVGLFITISEPDLQVFAGYIYSNDLAEYWILIIFVGVGVGFFLVVAFLRTVLGIKLKYILLASYLTVFVMAFFVPLNFVPLAFDSGGVTTGPMSVPFIIAIGTGIASIRTDKGADDDGFGLTALCSVGPILAVMIMALVMGTGEINPSGGEIVPIENSQQLIASLGKEFPTYMLEVLIALLPIIVFFFIFYFAGARVGEIQLKKIIIGMIYTYVGLVLFLVGVNFGFSPIGTFIGKAIGEKSYNWIIVPIGMVIGFFVVAAEPAVHVLTKQVYEITSGRIPKKALLFSLMAGVAVSIGLAMLRILLHINILYFLIPCYVIALIMAFIVPDIFTAIAFDSGGVASGAMAAGFIIPLAIGVCEAVGGNVATEGFGVVAMVAMTPLVTIQILGLIYKIKVNKINKKTKSKRKYKEKIID